MTFCFFTPVLLGHILKNHGNNPGSLNNQESFVKSSRSFFFKVAQVVERPLKRQKDVPRRGVIHIHGEKSG